MLIKVDKVYIFIDKSITFIKKKIQQIYYWRWQVPEHLKSRLPHVAEMHITHGIPSPKDIIPNSNAEFSIRK